MGSDGIYSARGGLVVSRLAGHLEGDIVGGVALELKGRRGPVVEVLVDELEIKNVERASANLPLLVPSSSRSHSIS